MRLHTKLDYIGVAYALQQAKRAGYVTGDVMFAGGLKPYGSRTHPGAFEVQLGTYEKDSLPEGYRDQNGQRLHVRRFKNTGDSGASSEWATGENIWAATWDEWGWFIAYVFAADPDARFGHYASYAGFMTQTNGKFDLEKRPAGEGAMKLTPREVTQLETALDEEAKEKPAPEYRVKVTSPEVPEIDHRTREAYDAAVEDMRRVQRNLDEDRVSHDTVREQTGEDA